MRITRRNFLESISIAAGMSAFGAAPILSGAKLKLGILSDIHLRGPGTETTFVKALTWFKNQGADGVIVAGDMADQGLVAQLQLVADSWYKVFPNDKADDGRHVEKLFVYGNHDWEGWSYVKMPKDDKVLAIDWPKNWEKCFHEPFAPVYSKTVKGYTFIGMHWGYQKLLKEFIEKTASRIDPKQPFFFSQHAHPLNTCYGPWAWGAWDDHNAATAALSRFPNAIAFSGHSHYSLTDERSIWQGAFTSIGTASLSYIGLPYGRENGGTGNSKLLLHMPPIRTGNGKQGMLLSVFGDKIVIQRREFVYDESVGPDWVLPLPCSGAKDMPYAFDKRAAQTLAPEFAAGAKVTLTEGKGKCCKRPGEKAAKEETQITVSFPTATFHDTRDRIFDYEVQAQVLDCDTVKPFCAKRVFAENFFLNDSRIAKTGKCVFGLDEIPKGQNVRFAVFPRECFGKAGTPIFSGTKRYV